LSENIAVYNPEPTKAEAVRNRLQDDPSREIFDILLEFLRTGNDAAFQEHISNPLLDACGLDHKVSELRKLQESGIQLIQWGLGSFGQLLLTLLLRHYRITPDYICDRNASKETNFSLNHKFGRERRIPIIVPDELFASHRNAAVICGSTQYDQEMRAELLKHDFPENRIFHQLTGELKRDDDYFCREFLTPVPDEIYIDCGVLDCGSVKNFIAFSNEAYKKIYAFEPDVGSFNKCLDIVARDSIKRLELLNNACWSERCTISFDTRGDGGSAVSESGSHQIKAVAIDDVVDDDNVTFIKMDIEGAELEALKGAAKTITRCKPRMAICVYHKPGDIIEIPSYVLSLVPSYKLYLCHDSYLMSETVMYFI
jgi:FkbM family methyltransferase